MKKAKAKDTPIQEPIVVADPFEAEDYTGSHTVAGEHLNKIIGEICFKAWRNEIVDTKLKPSLIDEYFKKTVCLYKPR